MAKRTKKERELVALKKQLNRCKYEWTTISRESGLSLNWIRKFALGQTANPGVLTLEKLETYFEQKAAR